MIANKDKRTKKRCRKMAKDGERRRKIRKLAKIKKLQNVCQLSASNELSPKALHERQGLYMCRIDCFLNGVYMTFSYVSFLI